MAVAALGGRGVATALWLTESMFAGKSNDRTNLP